ncbi:DEKNAAC103444 [Brettanomyces naardenensis]|uniref:DEKNAAC103444 n=1 Tax=Brettanomyces naardenensis TaxID=13370 RepID=A0A448YNM5_BRENA|nr:DEKNAAC103444 [Brettanomyces naardenensis]
MSSRRTRRQQLRRPQYTDDALYEDASSTADGVGEEVAEEVTRCVCGSDELVFPENPGSDFDDVDPGFFIQCELCSVWQHGFCVGIKGEVNAPEKFWCEQCRPDMHYLFIDKYGIQRSRYNPLAEHDNHPGRRSSRRKRESPVTEEDVKNEVESEKDSVDPPKIEEDEIDDFDDENSTKEEREERRKRARTTMNSSRDYDYEAMLKKALEESARESGVQPEEVVVSSNEAMPYRNTRASSKRRITSQGNTPEESESENNDKDNASSTNGASDPSSIATTSATVVNATTMTTPRSLRHSDILASDKGSPSASGNDSSEGTSRSMRPSRSSRRRTAAAAVAAAIVAKEGYQNHDSGSESGSKSASGAKPRSRRSKRAKPVKETKFGEDKPFKANIPSTRINMNEMRRRIFSIMEFISNIQIELSNEEDTKNSLLRMRDEDPSGELSSEENMELQKTLISCYNDSVVRLDSLTKRLNDWENKYR